MDTREQASVDEAGVFRVHLPGLLNVLAEHLYSNRSVALRELLQNAHDSCIRRALEHPDPIYSPRIEVTVDARRGTLMVADNGAGLTPDEVRDYLATIGSSYTRDLKAQLASFAPEAAAQLVGQFGFGFLSAYLIASDVTLTTRSISQGSPALRWQSAGDERYELTEISAATVGTRVELRLIPGAAYLLDEQVLARLIRKYTDFLPVPIYLGSDAEPINATRPPWHADDREPAIRAYIAGVYGVHDPLIVVQLHDHTVALGDDTVTIPLRGFLFVPAVSAPSVHEFGDLRVYIRGMFIRDGERELLPDWARFARGVIDCPQLQPTASREDIHQDDDFAAVQQALSEQLGAALRETARTDAYTWRRFVAGHTDLLTGWAVRDDDFFELVADTMVFRTTRGRLSLPEYLTHTGSALYVVTRELGSLQEQLLAEGNDLPIIDASWFAVQPFLARYAARHPRLALVELDKQPERLLRGVSGLPYSALIDHFARRGVRAKAAFFAPEVVPALMAYPSDADLIFEAQSALDQHELPDPLAELVEDFVGRRAPGAAPPGTLYLNAASPLVRKLAESATGGQRNALVLDLIYEIARLFAGRTMTARDAAASFERVSNLLQEVPA